MNTRETMRVVRVKCVAAVTLLVLAGCGTDLGECDETMLGGSVEPGMERPNSAQAIVNASCAGGRCHSADASGGERVGVPAGLNFDVLPLAPTPAEAEKVIDGAGNVSEWAEEMWALIDDGDMPPAPPAGPGALGATDKEIVRNWLACDAPVIIAVQPTTGGDWASLWSALAPSCVACHQPATASAAGQGFVLADLSDACTAYRNIVNKPALTPACANMANVVVPSNAAGSLLVQKLRGTQTCGAAMPLGAAGGLAATNEPLVAAIEQWIAAGALPPAGCTP